MLSRGSEPIDFKTELTQQLLEQEGVADSITKCEELYQDSLDWADQIIAMKQHHREFIEDKFSFSDKETEVWSINKTEEEILREGRETVEQIKDKVRGLKDLN